MAAAIKCWAARPVASWTGYWPSHWECMHPLPQAARPPPAPANDPQAMAPPPLWLLPLSSAGAVPVPPEDRCPQPLQPR